MLVTLWPLLNTSVQLAMITQDLFLIRPSLLENLTSFGLEQTPDVTGKSVSLRLQRVFGRFGTSLVEKFLENGADFVVCDTTESLVEGMNILAEKVLCSAFKLHSIHPTIRLSNQFSPFELCSVK